MSKDRSRLNRCPARKGTWECQFRAGHPGEHVNHRGRQYWGVEVTDPLAKVTAELWRTERPVLRLKGGHDG